ncbi:MAG: ribosome biogenesis GTPase YlqF [Clostridiales bacterium]|nr:ribosome biogenesis GTPase YlqF [Clostridiales bacterium]
MDINWFPGHMAKSTREIEDSLRSADCALYVLDSRAVKSCFNPAFDKMITVPIVYVLNKTDTVDASDVDAWIKRLNSERNVAVAVEGTSSSCRKKLLAAIKNVCAPTLERQRKRGLNEHIRAVVVGVPNTGKSTVINSLCGKARLITGDRAGVTRAAKWARVDETLDVLDTPGTLYPKITERTVGENLAVIGSIKDEVLDVTELAFSLVGKLNRIDKSILASRYGKEIDGVECLDEIAGVRGFKMRGGAFDTERAAAALIDDYRKGRLGKIALEYADER